MWKWLCLCCSKCDGKGIETFSPPCFGMFTIGNITFTSTHQMKEKKKSLREGHLRLLFSSLLLCECIFFLLIYFTKAHNHKQGPCFSFSLRWPLQSWKHWICSCALFVERKQKWMKINPLITRCWQKWISGHAHIWEIFTWGHMGLSVFPITIDGSQKRAPSLRHWSVFGTERAPDSHLSLGEMTVPLWL